MTDSIFSTMNCAMNKNSKKLIVWDFDGVIADTECLWMENRRQLLKKYFNIDWDLKTTNHYLGGMHWTTRLQTLQKMGFDVDKKFEDEGTKLDLQVLGKGISLTPNIEKIFARTDIKQCIATGGSKEKTQVKLKSVGIDKLFTPDKVFLSEMVAQGKPAPDLFLFAAEKMGEKPENCLIIEDSLAGLKAGLAAKMETIAFVGSKMNNNEEYIAQVKALGIKHIFKTMDEIYHFIFG